MALELYDIMGNDMFIEAYKVKGGIQVLVENEEGEELYNETSHPFAWDSLVYFAQQVLDINKRLEQEA